MHFFQLLWIQPILFSNFASRRLGCANFFALMLRRLGWEWWKDWPTSCAFTSSFCRFVAVTNISASFNIDHIQVFQYLKIWFKCMVRSHEIIWFQRHPKALKTSTMRMRCQSCNWTAYRCQHSDLLESGLFGAWFFNFQGINYSVSG